MWVKEPSIKDDVVVFSYYYVSLNMGWGCSLYLTIQIITYQVPRQLSMGFPIVFWKRYKHYYERQSWNMKLVFQQDEGEITLIG